MALDVKLIIRGPDEDMLYEIMYISNFTERAARACYRGFRVSKASLISIANIILGYSDQTRFDRTPYSVIKSNTDVVFTDNFRGGYISVRPSRAVDLAVEIYRAFANETLVP